MKKQIRSLIVEDEFISRTILEEMLSRFGQVDVAVNGAQAVDAFTSALESESWYDVICLDLMLPDMHGRDVLSKIREAERAAAVPSDNAVKVIVTTSSREPENIQWALEEGCEGFLVKPFHKIKLLGQLGEFGLIR